MNPVQSNLPPFPLATLTTGAASLVDKEGYLVKLDNTGKVLVPAATSDLVVGVVENGAAVGGNCDVRYLAGIVRVKVGASAIVAGDRVFTSAGGTVIPATGAGSATYRSIGVALSAAAAGGYVPVLVQLETVTV